MRSGVDVVPKVMPQQRKKKETEDDSIFPSFLSVLESRGLQVFLRSHQSKCDSRVGVCAASLSQAYQPISFVAVCVCVCEGVREGALHPPGSLHKTTHLDIFPRGFVRANV